MREFILKIAQGGTAAGEAFLLKKTGGAAPAVDVAAPAAESAVQVEDRDAEIARFDEAVASLEKELSAAAAKASENNAEIFEMERILLEDEKYIDAIREQIKNEGIDAALAAERTGRKLAAEIGGAGNDYIGQRGTDVSGMTERLVSLLRGEEESVLNAPAILVADELSPARLSAIDPDLILGIVTVAGSPTSHVSILAGNLEVPYYYGSEEAIAAVSDGMAASAGGEMKMILKEGRLILEPDEESFATAVRAMEEAKTAREREKQAMKAAGSDAAAAARTKVCANIAGPQDIDALIESGAEGVGLFRTELLFLNNEAAPAEEEQLAAYRSVAEAMEGKEVVIRTMDLGSDKKANWLRLPEEPNPALGCRGLRVDLKEKDLFRIQLRALMRAAAFGNVRIMVPMVASVWEVDAVRAEMEVCAQGLTEEGLDYRVPPLGIMVETPAAAMIADELAQKVDFFSIGTNDLTQYTLALDREAQDLDEYYDPCHEAVLRLIKMTAAAGHKHNIPTAICGELAGNPDAIPNLIKSGVDELSVSVSKVGATKRCAAEAEAALRKAGALPLQEDETLQEDEAPRVAAHSGEAVAQVAAPADGKLIPMEDIPDPAFSSGMLGECVGILPEDGKIYAPCDGSVSAVAETKHAITFNGPDGRKILVHAGLDTVTLGGRGFTVYAKAGDTVSRGDLVMEADLDVIRGAGLSTIIVTVISR